jgi:hypothetical protein
VRHNEKNGRVNFFVERSNVPRIMPNDARHKTAAVHHMFVEAQSINVHGIQGISCGKSTAKDASIEVN